MLSQITNTLPASQDIDIEIVQYDLEKQNEKVSNSQLSNMKKSLFSLQRSQKIVILALLCVLLSVEGVDAIMKLFVNK